MHRMFKRNQFSIMYVSTSLMASLFIMFFCFFFSERKCSTIEQPEPKRRFQSAASENSCEPDRYRQSTDNNCGSTFSWPTVNAEPAKAVSAQGVLSSCYSRCMSCY